jgi:hypothetical protein
MSTSQVHGKTWETEILQNIYDLTPAQCESIPHGAKHDLPAELNRFDRCNVSIKTAGNQNRVDLGDCLRVFDTVSSPEPYHMIVVIYKQTENTKKLEKFVKLDLELSRRELFGNIRRSEIVELVNTIKMVDTGRSKTPLESARIHRLKTELNARSGAIQFNPKLDSKNQRRLQCSFNSFQKFLINNENRILILEDEMPEISQEIESGRRLRNKKAV